MIGRIAGEGQFVVDDSAVEELSERSAKLEVAIKLNDEVGFRLALAELLAWVRSVGRLRSVTPDALEPSDMFLPPEEATLDDARRAFAAVALYRKLVAAGLGPERLAAGLYSLRAQLFAPDDAVWVVEATGLYRKLAAADPDRYRPDLAASLGNFAAQLRADDAVLVSEEALALYRELVAADPDRYRRDLAASLDKLSARLSALGRLDDALLVTEEAAALKKALPALGAATSGHTWPASADTAGHTWPAFEVQTLTPAVQVQRRQPWVAYDDLVRRAFAELVQPGRLLFNPPDRMRLGDTERVEVRLTRTLTLDAELLKDLRGHGEPQLEEIPTSPLMAVTLKGDGFQITPYSDEEQSVTPEGITTWEFDIRALKRGQQRLVISVSLRIPVAGQPLERKSIPVREATIDVQVGAPALIAHFVSANWQWFVGTAIAIAAVLVAVLH